MTATAARGSGRRAAARGRSSAGGLERRGDDGRGRRQSDGCRALFYIKVHALKKKKTRKIPSRGKKSAIWTEAQTKQIKRKLTAMGLPRLLD